MESNVKRILAYQRTFQHYLANEEAGVNVYGAAGNAPSSSTRTTAQATQVTDSRKRSSAKEAMPAPTPKGGARRTSSLRHSKTTPVKTEETSSSSKADVEMTDTPQQGTSQPSSPTTSQKSPSSRQKQPPSPSASQQAAPPYDPAFDRDPLLRTLDLPKMPSDRVMQALLAEPPLSYTAARAKPLETPSDDTGRRAGYAPRTGNSAIAARPSRSFCSVCGYWGKVRCKYGCGDRVCGLLECWRGHEGVCSLAATAY